MRQVGRYLKGLLNGIVDLIRDFNWFGKPMPSYSYPVGPYPFTNDPAIADEKGNPLNPFVQYVPPAMLNYPMDGGSQYHADWVPQQLSVMMHDGQYPVLSNSYLGRAITRFFYAGAFGPTGIVTLEHDGSKAMVRGWHVEWGDIYDPDNPPPDPKPSITTLKEREISNEEWQKFQVLFDACDFWNARQFSQEVGMDGSSWQFESHTEAGYWYVSRWCAEGALAACGKYLFELCDFPIPRY